MRVLLGESPPPLLPEGSAAAAHTAPSAESLELRGPGAAHYDAVMAMVTAGAAAAEGPHPGGCAHAARADVFSSTPSQVAAAARECAGIGRLAALSPLTPAASAAETILNVARVHAHYWPCLRATCRAQERQYKKLQAAALRVASPSGEACVCGRGLAYATPPPCPLQRLLAATAAARGPRMPSAPWDLTRHPRGLL